MLQFKPKFEDFYETNYQRTLSYITYKIGNHHDAEDLTSEIFVYCYNHYDRYDPSKSSPQTWLFMIITCRLKNWYRDNRIELDVDDYINDFPDDPSHGVDAAVEVEELHEELMAAIRTLPERQQKIVIMRYFEDKSGQEIAEALNLSPGNVRVLLSRALKLLEKNCAHLKEAGF